MSIDLAATANPRLVHALLSGDASAVHAALPGATLLVPATGNGDRGAVVQTRRAAAAGTLLYAFTDLEALEAWDRDPPGAALALAAAAVADLVPGATVALNPAGPGTCVLDGAVLADGHRIAGANSGPPALESLAGTSDHALELADPSRRRPLRARASQSHELARHSAARGDLAAACERLQPALRACAELGDRLHGAAAALELADWRARSGSTKLALAGWRQGAETMAALGELDLALGALLDAAETAAGAGATAEADALAVAALDLAAGADFSDRLVSLWRSLDGP